MRLGLTLTLAAFAVIGSTGCVANSTTEANGYNVQLYFQGDALSAPLTVGETGEITVKRIELQAGRCTSSSQGCDPTTVTPIVLVSASCDQDLCAITPQSSDSGVVTLQTTGVAPGNTTLHVVVRSTIDGSEWEDGYPLGFRPARTLLDTPAVALKMHHAD